MVKRNKAGGLVKAGRLNEIAGFEVADDTVSAVVDDFIGTLKSKMVEETKEKRKPKKREPKVDS